MKLTKDSWIQKTRHEEKTMENNILDMEWKCLIFIK